MRLSRFVLTFSVMLIGALMMVSEAPEILTLTDNVGNDCESVQIVNLSRRRCPAENLTSLVVPALRPSAARPAEIGVQTAELSPASRSPRGVLLLTMTQRK